MKRTAAKDPIIPSGLGIKVSATLWLVEYRCVCETGCKEGQHPAGEHLTSGKAYILTADDSGHDLWQVARDAVLGGKATKGFAILSVHRAGDDVKGLARLQLDKGNAN